MVIFCDLDEVLEDFIGSALRVHGYDRNYLEARRMPGHWDITKPLGLSEEAFWEPIKQAGVGFWERIEPLPWFNELYDMLMSHSNSIYVVSSVGSGTVEEKVGKTLWVEKHLPKLPLDHLFFHSKKELFASIPDSVLIDDRWDNVTRFIAAGGVGTVFPSQGNCLYDQADNPLPRLESDLVALKNFM